MVVDPVPGALLYPLMQGLSELTGHRFECSAELTEEMVMVMAGPLEPDFAVPQNDGVPRALVDGLAGGTENGREIGSDSKPGQGLLELLERPGMRQVMGAQEGVELGPDF